VTEIGYVDTRELREAQRQRAEDKDTIELIRAYIRENDCCKQADIIAHVKDVAGTQPKTTNRILKHYKATDWHIRKGFEANRFEYSAKPF
jgi:cyclopropane fatty-acyl-phospholipid synthase-like methyltransferase